MTAHLQFDPIRLPPECDALRAEVRAFLTEESAAGTFDPHQAKDGDALSRAFSRRVGAKGWIGMTWPKHYGGHERTYLERYVVTEEFRVANAPVRVHFVADGIGGATKKVDIVGERFAQRSPTLQQDRTNLFQAAASHGYLLARLPFSAGEKSVPLKALLAGP